MKSTRLTAAGLAGAATVASLLAMTLGTTATSASVTSSTGHHSDWGGQPVTSVAAALKLGHAAAPRTLTVVAAVTRQSFVDVGAQGDSPGDQNILDLRLFDETGGTVVGRGQVQCQQDITTQICTATLRIYKQGQIVVSATNYPNQPRLGYSILGGTGTYKGAGGVARSFQTPTKQVLVLHFTR